MAAVACMVALSRVRARLGGLARSRRANWKHGCYSEEARVVGRGLREDDELARWEAEQHVMPAEYDDEALLREFD